MTQTETWIYRLVNEFCRTTGNEGHEAILIEAMTRIAVLAVAEQRLESANAIRADLLTVLAIEKAKN